MSQIWSCRQSRLGVNRLLTKKSAEKSPHLVNECTFSRHLRRIPGLVAQADSEDNSSV